MLTDSSTGAMRVSTPTTMVKILEEPDIEEAFYLYDTVGDGRISVSQIGDVLRAVGQNPTEVALRKCAADHKAGEYSETPQFQMPAFMIDRRCQIWPRKCRSTRPASAGPRGLHLQVGISTPLRAVRIFASLVGGGHLLRPSEPDLVKGRRHFAAGNDRPVEPACDRISLDEFMPILNAIGKHKLDASEADFVEVSFMKKAAQVKGGRRNNPRRRVKSYRMPPLPDGIGPLCSARGHRRHVSLSPPTADMKRRHCARFRMRKHGVQQTLKSVSSSSSIPHSAIESAAHPVRGTIKREGNGFIQAVEMRRILTSIGDRLTEEEAEQILEGLEDSQGNINYEGRFRPPTRVNRLLKG
ncbi:myosin-2 essential light chain-like [Tropilaelaps mercedesae]|uniref:Myosin-2 essential light chain-like n=1 Tax=Tropilaelaps mercedesae TaxID=418985 RepID=A0A1V9XG90_9ACAR|nr:myosin-2 essential light chain-like [Tropilaelaps mercedesae]